MEYYVHNSNSVLFHGDKLMRRMTVGQLAQLPKLSAKQAAFVVEYMKDFAPRRAAEASGYSADSGYSLVNNEKVRQTIDVVLQQRMEESAIDAEWLLYELVDNHRIARQQGNLGASNTALGLIAKHKTVDAFATEKLKVSTDSDVAERLAAARIRVKSSEKPIDAEITFF
jgi:hypothetical protein